MDKWNKATERVVVLLDDAVEQMDEAVAGMSHLSVIRRLMYSINAVSQWLTWIWVLSELTHLKPRSTMPPISAKSRALEPAATVGPNYSQTDGPELYDLVSVIEDVNGATDLMAVMRYMDLWRNALSEAQYMVTGYRLSEFDPEAYDYHESTMDDLFDAPTIPEAKYAPGQFPAVQTNILRYKDKTVYFADGEKLTDRPIGEVALIAGARLDRMHASVAEKMDDAMGADFALHEARQRLAYNSFVVKAFYDMKVQAEGTRHDKTDEQTVTGLEPASALADRKTA